MESVVEHADDPGGALIARRRQVELVHQAIVVGRAVHLDGSAVGNVGEQGTEREAHARAEALRDADELVAEQAPTQRGLGTEHEDDVAAGIGHQ